MLAVWQHAPAVWHLPADAAQHAADEQPALVAAQQVPLPHAVLPHSAETCWHWLHALPQAAEVVQQADVTLPQGFAAVQVDVGHDLPAHFEDSQFDDASQAEHLVAPAFCTAKWKSIPAVGLASGQGFEAGHTSLRGAASSRAANRTKLMGFLLLKGTRPDGTLPFVGCGPPRHFPCQSVAVFPPATATHHRFASYDMTVGTNPPEHHSRNCRNHL